MSWRLPLAPLGLLLLSLLCLLSVHVAPAQAATGPMLHAHASFGVGAASLTVLDPVDQLAIDIAEHLPSASGERMLPPLPAHGPVALPGEQAADEWQGAELPAPFDGSLASGVATPLRAPHFGAPFASTDPRRHKRPPRRAG